MLSYFIVCVLVSTLYTTDALKCYRCFGSDWCNNYTDPRFSSNVHQIECPTTNTAYNYDGNSPLLETMLKHLQEKFIRLNDTNILNDSQWGCVTTTLHEANEAHTVRTCLNNALSICPAIRNVVLNPTLNDISPDIDIDCEGCTDNLCNSQTFVESEQEESSSTTEAPSPSAPSTSPETSLSTTSTSSTAEASSSSSTSSSEETSSPSTSSETSLSTTTTSSTTEASSPSATYTSPESSSSTTSTSPVSEDSSQTAPLTSPSSPSNEPETSSPSGPTISPESSSGPTSTSSPSSGPETTEKQDETTVPDSGHPLIVPYLVLITAIMLDFFVL